MFNQAMRRTANYFANTYLMNWRGISSHIRAIKINHQNPAILPRCSPSDLEYSQSWVEDAIDLYYVGQHGAAWIIIGLGTRKHFAMRSRPVAIVWHIHQLVHKRTHKRFQLHKINDEQVEYMTIELHPHHLMWLRRIAGLLIYYTTVGNAIKINNKLEIHKDEAKQKLPNWIMTAIRPHIHTEMQPHGTW